MGKTMALFLRKNIRQRRLKWKDYNRAKNILKHLYKNRIVFLLEKMTSVCSFVVCKIIINCIKVTKR